MKPFFVPIFFLFALTLCVYGCVHSDDSDDDDAFDDAPGDDVSDDSADDDETQACDASRRPIVFVHGFLEEGDAFQKQSMRFASNGYCQERIYTYDYNTLVDFEGAVGALADFVQVALDETGADKVDLIGHSMGCAVSYTFLESPENAALVAHYANIAGGTEDAVPIGVPGLNISSEGDHIVGVNTMPGGENVTLTDEDHLQAATSKATFEALYKFFNDGEEPGTLDVLPENPLILSGRVVAFAENDPVPGIEIRVFRVEPETGLRMTDAPEATFVSDDNGRWGDFRGTNGAHYEFVCLDPELGRPPLHYYFSPFERSSDKVYFRVFPPKSSPLGWAFDLLPLSDARSIFAYLNLDQAVVTGRDELTLDGIDLTAPELADRSINTLVLFFFDTNFNGVSDDAPAPFPYTVFPFIRGFDHIVDADPPRPVRFISDGKMITIRNWRARTGGLSIAAFR